MILWIILLAIGLASSVLLTIRRGWRMGLIALLIFSLTVVTRNVAIPGFNEFSLTIPGLAVAGVAMIALLSGMPGLRFGRFVPFLIFVALFGVLGWDFQGQPITGVVVVVVMTLAWVAGIYAARVIRTEPDLAKPFVVFLAAIIALEAIVCVLQLAGAPIFLPGEITAELTAGRSNGTYGHPGNLGKGMILAASLLLFYTRDGSRFVRVVAYSGISLAMIPVGLSQGRANYIGMVLMVIVWAMLLPGRNSLGVKIFVPLATALVALVFARDIIARFAADPEGGQRGHLMAVALEHIPDNLWFGVGPGQFVPYFGLYDYLVAQGWPVHNMFVLEAAELGLIGVALLFIPLLVIPTVKAISSLRSSDEIGLHARAFIAVLCAIVTLSLTGWGLASGILSPLMAFVIGFMYERMSVPVSWGSRVGTKGARASVRRRRAAASLGVAG